MRRALTREVPWSFDRGLTTATLGRADVKLARQQHAAYVESLRAAGLEVHVLEADEGLPDSCFVEDTAVRIDDDLLVISSPGHPARAPEVQAVERYLSHYFAHVVRIEPPGTLDGGDVLRLENHFVIGLSERTNPLGAAQLGELIGRAGMTWQMQEVGEGLHLKSGCAYLGHDTVLCWPRFEKPFQKLGLKVLRVDDDSANVVRLVRRLWVPAGFPRTSAMLRAHGFQVTELDISEFRKQDGGLTCLSILY